MVSMFASNSTAIKALLTTGWFPRNNRAGTYFTVGY